MVMPVNAHDTTRLYKCSTEYRGLSGTLKARLIIEHHHTFYIHRSVQEDYIYASHAARPRGPLSVNIKDDQFVEAVLTQEELDLGKALEQIMGGNFIVKDLNQIPGSFLL
jgi:hypothetical protein